MVELAEVTQFLGFLRGHGMIRQVVLEVKTGPNKGKTITRNIFGPVRVGDSVHVVNISKDEKIQVSRKR